MSEIPVVRNTAPSQQTRACTAQFGQMLVLTNLATTRGMWFPLCKFIIYIYVCPAMSQRHSGDISSG
jgi:hypothetical protein